MADYDRAELARLQHEAAARIREMHARAQSSSDPPAQKQSASGQRQPEASIPMPSFVRIPYEQNPAGEEESARRNNAGRHAATAPAGRPSTCSQDAAVSSPPARQTSRSRTYVRKKQSGLDLMRMLNFKNIDLDSDRTLILMILLLLSGEEKDQYLTLALLYLML